jgi:hypothetical protein
MTNWYTISYPMGASGMFLIYFISLHEQFLHYDVEYSNNNYMAKYFKDYSNKEWAKNIIVPNEPHPVDLIAHYIDISWQYRKTSWLDYTANFYPHKNKIIIRPVPHGTNSYQYKVYIPLDIMQQQKHIILISKDWQWLYDRNKELVLQFAPVDSEVYNHFKKEFDITLIWWKDNLKNTCNYFDRYNCNYVCVDPYKLLKLDANEYNKLLTFIDEKPLSNWKDIITEYVNTIHLKL